MKGFHSGLNLSKHLASVMGRFGLENGRVLGIMTDNATSNYAMARELQKSLKSMEVEWSAAQNHVPCMAHVIQLALSAFMQSLGIKGQSKSWEEGVRETLNEDSNGRKGKVGCTRVKKVQDMQVSFSKIIEKVCACSMTAEQGWANGICLSSNDC